MTGIWNACVQAASDAFGTSRTMAKLFVIGLFTWMGLMILETWFIWAGLIATILAILGILLVLEYSLRVWYAVRNRPQPSIATVPVLSSSAPIVSDRPSVVCADAQGRIDRPDLSGHDVNAMAEQILRKACMRKVSCPRPSWLRFPAISRAMPRLAAAGRVVFAMLAR